MAMIAVGVAPASAALAAGTAKGGPIKLWVLPSTTGTSAKHPGKILITGAIGDYGSTITTNSAGKATKNGGYALLKLKKGTILVNASTLGAAFAGAKPTTINTSNCSAAFRITAPVTLVRGTGAYVGITGTVDLTVETAGIAPKSKTGACTFKTTTKTVATFTIFTGTGTVSF